MASVHLSLLSLWKKNKNKKQVLLWIRFLQSTLSSSALLGFGAPNTKWVIRQEMSSAVEVLLSCIRGSVRNWPMETRSQTLSASDALIPPAFEKYKTKSMVCPLKSTICYQPVTHCTCSNSYANDSFHHMHRSHHPVKNADMHTVA